MSTQRTSARRRARLAGALAALALTAAVLVLAAQANSISTGPQVPPMPAQTARSANPDLRASSHTAVGCPRRTYGCQHRLRANSHTAVGCRRPKYGCPQGANTIAKRP